MRRCANCGAELPESAQFCGRCGWVADSTTDMTKTVSSSTAGELIDQDAPTIMSTQPEAMRGMPAPTAPFASFASLAPVQDIQTGAFTSQEEEEEERRRRLLLGLPLAGALPLAGQFPGGTAPMVQGAPAPGGVPAVQGTPQFPGAPQAPGNMAWGQSAPGNVAPAAHGAAGNVPSMVQPAQGPFMPHPSTMPHPQTPLPHTEPHPSGEHQQIRKDHKVHHAHHAAKAHKAGIAGHGVATVAVVVPVTLVVIAVGVLATVFVFIPPALGLSGTAISGLGLQVHGSHFVPGGSVTLTLDGNQTVTPVHPISISASGDFDASIAGTENWSVGQHTIRASESTLSRSATLSFRLTANRSTVTPSVSSFTVPGGSCTYAAKQGWTCTATLGISGNGQGKVKWTASSTGMSGITFTPASGILSPGQMQQVSIFVPDTICPASATLTFSGWANPINLRWSCAAPNLTWPGVTCPQQNGYYVCPIPLSLAKGSQGMVRWVATSPSPGVLFSVSGGVLAVGQTQTVNVSIPTSECRTATFTFGSVGGNKYTSQLIASRCP